MSQTDLDEATARRYANLIGDTILLDDDGLTIVRSGMEVIARIKLDWEHG